MPQNATERTVADRNALLAILVSDDRWATAALERGDDRALLRRIVKAQITDALPLAVERAWMRGEGRHAIMRAASITLPKLESYVATVYAR